MNIKREKEEMEEKVKDRGKEKRTANDKLVAFRHRLKMPVTLT